MNPTATTPHATLAIIPINKIIPHPDNPRGKLTLADVGDLVPSVKKDGVITPITVTKAAEHAEDQYHLIAGHRRVFAAQICEQTEIKAYILPPMTEQRRFELLTLENEQREDLTPLQKANSYRIMQERFKYTVPQIAQALQISTRSVYDALAFSKLIPDVQKKINDGTLSYSHAVLFTRLDPTQQKDLLNDVIEHERVMSVRALDETIHKEYLINLSKAPFKWDDPELHKPAGACTTCPKRIEEGKKSYCGDKTCYDKKTDNHLAAIIAATKAKHGKQLVFLSEFYPSPEILKRYPGTKSPYHWKDTTATPCKHAVPGIIVEPNRFHIGKLLAVCTDKSCTKHWQQTRHAQQSRSTSTTSTAAELAKAKREDEIHERLIKEILLTAGRKKYTTLPRFILVRMWNQGTVTEDIRKELKFPSIKFNTTEKNLELLTRYAVVAELSDELAGYIGKKELAILKELGINYTLLRKKVQQQYDAEQKAAEHKKSATVADKPPQHSGKPKARKAVKNSAHHASRGKRKGTKK